MMTTTFVFYARNRCAWLNESLLQLTVTTIKDFLRKLSREATTDRHTETPAQSVMTTSSILPTIPRHHVSRAHIGLVDRYLIRFC